MEQETTGVRILIDRGKCRFSMYDPLGCKVCLQVCPGAIFAARPIHKRDFSIPKEQRVDPTIWTLVIPWEDHCNGCGACVRACPYGAITIEMDGVPLKF